MSSLPRVWWLHVLGVMWLAGVTSYWWHRVSPVADVVIPLFGDEHAGGSTNQGDIVVSLGVGPGLGWNSTGPIDVVSSSTGERKYRRLEAGDAILAWPIGGQHIAASNTREVKVVDLESGRTVVSAPTSGEPTAMFSLDGRSVAIALDNTVSMYSLETGERRWIREFTVEQYVPSGQRHPGLAIEVRLYAGFRNLLRVDVYSFDRRQKDGLSYRDALRREFLSAASGQPDFRFGPKDQINESADGRLVIPAAQMGDQQVYDLTEGRTLWKMQSIVNWRGFSSDSREVWELSIADGQPVLRRWRAIDGTPLQPDDFLTRSHLTGMVSDDCRFIVAMVPSEGVYVPVWLRTLCASLKLGWNGEILPPREDLSLIDRQTGRTLVLATEKGTIRMQGPRDNLTFGALDRDRFTVHEANSVTVYRFDPPRNWWWLAGWGLGPVVLVMGVSRCRARRRALRLRDVV